MSLPVRDRRLLYDIYRRMNEKNTDSSETNTKVNPDGTKTISGEALKQFVKSNPNLV